MSHLSFLSSDLVTIQWFRNSFCSLIPHLRYFTYFSHCLEWPTHSLNVLVTQSCPALCDAMDCSPPGSSVHRIFQARILEWVAISSSMGSSQPRNRTWVSCNASIFFIPQKKFSYKKKKKQFGTSLVVQWLRLLTSTSGITSLISGWGTKILHAAAWPK